MPSVLANFPDFFIRRAQWPDDEVAIRCVRERVFVNEQSVPTELEWDGQDAQCEHVLAITSTDEIIGTGRLLPDGHLGRMAVLRPWRGRGVGSALLNALVELAREDCRSQVILNAQVPALPFYERYGFQALGDEFMEAGIPHRKMRLSLAFQTNLPRRHGPPPIWRRSLR